MSTGTTQNVTASCQNWGNDNPGVLSITQSGLITALADGVSAVWTTCQGVYGQGYVTLTVIPEQVFIKTGVGDNVFDIPTYVGRIRIQGQYPGRIENFIVYVAGRLVVNDIIGTSRNPAAFDGTYVISGGRVEIQSSSGVNWTFTEVR
jgi:hypothetical protein